MDSKISYVHDNLGTVKPEDLDMAQLKMNYERFRELAKNPNLTPELKLAFAPEYRVDRHQLIADDILGKLYNLKQPGKTFVDIGCGCGELADILLDFCERQNHNIVLVDCPEMLAHHDKRKAIQVPGMYPKNAKAVSDATNGGADAVLCYSVIHTMYVDTNLFAVIDSILDLLKPGGIALIGDIPNMSKRRRFFSSSNGISFHKKFMNTDQPPIVNFLKTEHDNIDDAVLHSLIMRAQAAGCDAYLVPQHDDLPSANRRDDLLIRKP